VQSRPSFFGPCVGGMFGSNGEWGTRSRRMDFHLRRRMSFLSFGWLVRVFRCRSISVNLFRHGKMYKISVDEMGGSGVTCD